MTQLRKMLGIANVTFKQNEHRLCKPKANENVAPDCRLSANTDAAKAPGLDVPLYFPQLADEVIE
jgi:hypothetical protein